MALKQSFDTTLALLCHQPILQRDIVTLTKQRLLNPMLMVNSDVLDVRFHWVEVKAKLIAELTSDTFNFKPLQKVTKSTDEVIHVWTSIDSLVLKLLSIALSRYLSKNGSELS